MMITGMSVCICESEDNCTHMQSLLFKQKLWILKRMRSDLCALQIGRSDRPVHKISTPRAAVYQLLNPSILPAMHDKNSFSVHETKDDIFFSNRHNFAPAIMQLLAIYITDQIVYASFVQFGFLWHLVFCCTLFFQL